MHKYSQSNPQLSNLVLNFLVRKTKKTHLHDQLVFFFFLTHGMEISNMEFLAPEKSLGINSIRIKRL